MTCNIGQRPPVWVGHVYLSVTDVGFAAQWLETVGLRSIVVRDEAAVLEMRGGTHVVVRRARAAGGTAPFDLMVDDLDAAHRDYAEKGLSPSPIRQRQARYDHDSFELPGPDGWVFTVYSSHVGDRPVRSSSRRCAKANSQEHSVSTQTEPWIKGREDAEIIRPFGNEMKVMLPSAYTGGTCSVLFADLKPGEGAPPHVHREYDEYFFVVEGTVSLVVDGKESTIVPGNLVFTPRGAVHSFKNIGASTASMLEWTVPGGNEPYFRAVSKMASFDPKRLAEINEQFATEFIELSAGEPGTATSGHDRKRTS